MVSEKAGRALRAIDEGYFLGIAMRVVDPHSVLRDYIILCVKSCTESPSVIIRLQPLRCLCA